MSQGNATGNNNNNGMNLSPAPLWRNAPTIVNNRISMPSSLMMMMAQSSIVPSSSSSSSQQQQISHPSSATTMANKSFQQSLRSYPSNSGQQTNSSLNNSKSLVKLRNKSNLSNNSRPTNIYSKTNTTTPVTDVNQPRTRCFITNLDEEHSKTVSPFYLDYLDQQQQHSTTSSRQTPILMDQQQQQQFDHGKFMDMFRHNRLQQQQDQSTNNSNLNSMDTGDFGGAGGSLPYSVNDNNDSIAINQRIIHQQQSSIGNKSSTNDHLKKEQQQQQKITNVGQQQQQQKQQSNRTTNHHQMMANNNRMMTSSTNNHNLRDLSSNRRLNSQNTMDNRSSSIQQRIQSAAERRAQIEDAKRERVQRHMEQSSMKNIIHGGHQASFNPITHQQQNSPQASAYSAREQPFLPGHSTNSSLAFGSTQPRNIDLTRPLVTPLMPVRPKSEIFTSTIALPYNNANTAATNSAGSKHQTNASVYAKDDINYKTSRSSSNNSQQPTMVVDSAGQFFQPIQAPQASIEPMVQAKHQQPLQVGFGGSSSGFASFFRAGRRHDPELIPAKQKYLFREYGAPSSSGWSFGAGSHLKKENSMMTCSMTSTKSFNPSKHSPGSAISAYSHVSSSFGNRPKKSYSMNRLDQLAQPRKRVQPKAPLTTTTTTTDGPSCKSSFVIRSDKPTPPPKNFSSTSTMINKNKVGISKESPTTSSARLASGKKPRPLSQIEQVKLEPSSPVFESPLSDDKNKTDDDDKLAEYQKQLAEKRAQYRKQQEQKLKELNKKQMAKDSKTENEETDKSDDKPHVPVAKPVPRRPRSTIISGTANTGNSSSSSITSGTNETKSLADETKESMEKEQIKDVNLVSTETTKTNETSNSSSSSSNSSSSSDSNVEPQQKQPEIINNIDNNKNISSQDSFDDEKTLMKTSLEDNVKQMSINDQTSSQKTCDDSVLQSSMDKSQMQPNTMMTTSFDSSLLHSTSPAATLVFNNSAVGQQQQQSNNNNNNIQNTSNILTPEQIEERQMEMLKKHKLERLKRKSRIQEILKGRTRKDDGVKLNDNNNNKDESMGSSLGSVGESGSSMTSTVVTSSTDSSLETATITTKMVVPNGRSNEAQTNGHHNDDEEHLIQMNSDKTFVKTNGTVAQQQQQDNQDDSQNKANGF